MYLARPGQEEEEFIGYIESWLILKPTAHGGPERNNDWEALLQVKSDEKLPESSEDTAIALQSLYQSDGSVQPTISFGAASDQRPDDEVRIADDLGPQGTELVYINCFWIHVDVRLILSTFPDYLIINALLTCLLRSTVFRQWDRSSCLELVL